MRAHYITLESHHDGRLSLTSSILADVQIDVYVRVSSNQTNVKLQ